MLKFTLFLQALTLPEQSSILIKPAEIIIQIGQECFERQQVITYLESNNLTFGSNADFIHVIWEP